MSAKKEASGSVRSSGATQREERRGGEGGQEEELDASNAIVRLEVVRTMEELEEVKNETRLEWEILGSQAIVFPPTFSEFWLIGVRKKNLPPSLNVDIYLHTISLFFGNKDSLGFSNQHRILTLSATKRFDADLSGSSGFGPDPVYIFLSYESFPENSVTDIKVLLSSSFLFPLLSSLLSSLFPLPFLPDCRE